MCFRSGAAACLLVLMALATVTEAQTTEFGFDDANCVVCVVVHKALANYQSEDCQRLASISNLYFQDVAGAGGGSGAAFAFACDAARGGGATIAACAGADAAAAAAMYDKYDADAYGNDLSFYFFLPFEIDLIDACRFPVPGDPNKDKNVSMTVSCGGGGGGDDGGIELSSVKLPPTTACEPPPSSPGGGDGGDGDGGASPSTPLAPSSHCGGQSVRRTISLRTNGLQQQRP